jgi:hypothetical protein
MVRSDRAWMAKCFGARMSCEDITSGVGATLLTKTNDIRIDVKSKQKPAQTSRKTVQVTEQQASICDPGVLITGLKLMWRRARGGTIQQLGAVNSR